MSNSNAPNLAFEEAQCIMINHFGLVRMEEYYVSFKEKQSIQTDAQFEVESSKNAFPDIYYQIDLVCARLMPSQNTIEVPIEVAILIACIMDYVHINVGEIITDQFKRRAKQQATSLPYPSLVSKFQAVAAPATTPPDLLKIAQMAQVHESQIMKLAKAISSMINKLSRKPCNLLEIS
ncbi:hypothetical protein HAX54_026467 [Datura stramonium]|uniref:Putative plant transposon protein domain-containing protein n=1 Tax=Datura stramonium TaxID=4076 RepID=A0ABS8S7U1_DATST|nr:hypothetical protein [Datura stramonium]